MFTLTAILLFAVYIAAEFYRFQKRVTGWIREIRPMPGDPSGLSGARLQVVTSKSGEITAFASGCQLCVFSLEIGKTVSLIPGPNGYIMKSPWISRRQRGICPRGMPS
jgi:hypothetical protein